MSTTRIPRAARLAVFVSALAGCSSSTDVSPSLVGRYLLENAAGQPLPALVHTAVDPSQPPIDIYVVGDSIEILDGGRYTQHARLEARSQGTLLSTQRWSDHGIVTRNGKALHFESDFLQNVTFDGTVGAGGKLSVTQNLASEGTPDLYVFTPAP